MLQASKKPRELDNAMQDEIGIENGVFEFRGHHSGTVVSTVARKHKENTKPGVPCGRPYGRINGRMQRAAIHCSRFTVARHCSSGREFLNFYDLYAASMPGYMTTRKGFL